MEPILKQIEIHYAPFPPPRQAGHLTPRHPFFLLPIQPSQLPATLVQYIILLRPLLRICPLITLKDLLTPPLSKPFYPPTHPPVAQGIPDRYSLQPQGQLQIQIQGLLSIRYTKPARTYRL